MSSWNPELYLQFKNERTRPSIDLVSRIKIEAPERIIDIGCGPGNSTRVLHCRWPLADITGIDKSEEMIKKARKDYPDQKWAVGDASSLKVDTPFDVVFSNAALQWIPKHEVLIPGLFKLVSVGGALAVQVPGNNESPLHQAVYSIAAEKQWRRYTAGCEKLLNYRSAEYYYTILQPIASDIELWETVYYHVLSSHQELIEWYKGTGMRPFLDSLPDEKRRISFEKQILKKCKEDYKKQKDGKILYPFKRIFFIAYK
jgi:trans-aconitate 2-methyltransferase